MGRQGPNKVPERVLFHRRAYHVQPRTRNSTNNIGIGMPISQSKTHPAAPRSVLRIAILHCIWVYGCGSMAGRRRPEPGAPDGVPGSGPRALPRRGRAYLHRRLFRVGDILCPGLLKDRLGTVPLGTIFRMDGNQHVAFFDFPLVPLGLIFWDTHPNQGAREAP